MDTCTDNTLAHYTASSCQSVSNPKTCQLWFFTRFEFPLFFFYIYLNLKEITSIFITTVIANSMIYILYRSVDENGTAAAGWTRYISLYRFARRNRYSPATVHLCTGTGSARSHNTYDRSMALPLLNAKSRVSSRSNNMVP